MSWGHEATGCCEKAKKRLNKDTCFYARYGPVYAGIRYNRKGESHWRVCGGIAANNKFSQ